MNEAFAWLLIIVLATGFLSLGVIVGDSLPWRGRRARIVSSWVALISLPVLLLSIFNFGPDFLTPLSYMPSPSRPPGEPASGGTTAN